MRHYLLLLLPLWLSGASLDSLIQNATATHTSLSAIEKKLSALSHEYDASRNFTNPELSINVSDIHINDPLKRSLEPMQYTAINLKQKIPYFGKIKAKGAKVNAKKKSVLMNLEDAKVKLSKAIKITAYTIWQIEQELRITDEYIKLTRQNIELFTAYNNSDTSSHMGIMSAELSLSQLKITKGNHLSLLDSFYKQIRYLSATDVTSIELRSEITKPKEIDTYIELSQENTFYKLKLAKVKEAEADTKLNALSRYADPVVGVGYYHRESIEDYISIGVSFSLPIYGSENSKEQYSRELALSQISETNDFKNLLAFQIYELHAKLQNAYKTYNIIQKESLPQIQHMFDLSSSTIKNGGELFIYIDMLEKKLLLEKQSIDAVASYHKTSASLDALIGKIQ